jgi:hypothetical protein
MKLYVTDVKHIITEAKHHLQFKDPLHIFEVVIAIESGQEPAEKIPEDEVEELILTRLQNLEVPGIENFNAEEARKISEGTKAVDVLQEIRRKALNGKKSMMYYKALTGAEILHLKSKGFHIRTFISGDDTDFYKYEIIWDEKN